MKTSKEFILESKKEKADKALKNLETTVNKIPVEKPKELKIEVTK